MQRRYVARNKEKLKKYYSDRYFRLSQDPRWMVIRNCKSRADLKGVPFNLSIDDIEVPDTCPVLGITLKRGEGKFCDSSPSLDRIIPEKGYVKGNVIVVSWKANRLKNDATIQELDSIVRFYSKILPPKFVEQMD